MAWATARTDGTRGRRGRPDGSGAARSCRRLAPCSSRSSKRTSGAGAEAGQRL